MASQVIPNFAYFFSVFKLTANNYQYNKYL